MTVNEWNLNKISIMNSETDYDIIGKISTDFLLQNSYIIVELPLNSVETMAYLIKQYTELWYF